MARPERRREDAKALAATAAFAGNMVRTHLMRPDGVVLVREMAVE